MTIHDANWTMESDQASILFAFVGWQIWVLNTLYAVNDPDEKDGPFSNHTLNLIWMAIMVTDKVLSLYSKPVTLMRFIRTVIEIIILVREPSWSLLYVAAITIMSIYTALKFHFMTKGVAKAAKLDKDEEAEGEEEEDVTLDDFSLGELTHIRPWIVHCLQIGRSMYRLSRHKRGDAVSEMLILAAFILLPCLWFGAIHLGISPRDASTAQALAILFFGVSIATTEMAIEIDLLVTTWVMMIIWLIDHSHGIDHVLHHVIPSKTIQQFTT